MWMSKSGLFLLTVSDSRVLPYKTFPIDRRYDEKWWA
jgi:hypothetical protein